jgi:parallel beta-helix repeat protein
MANWRHRRLVSAFSVLIVVAVMSMFTATEVEGQAGPPTHQTILDGIQAILNSVQTGVVLINQDRALAGGVSPGDAPGFPVTISQPGSYRLSSNLTPVATDAIEITTSDVTIDLNSFTIVGVAGSGRGVNAQGRSRIIVTNGIVRGMGSDGVVVGDDSRVERVHAIGNGGDGIQANDGGTVTGNTARDNGGAGIQVNDGGTVTGNTAFGNNGDGIQAGDGSTVIGNAVRANADFGLRLLGTSGYTQNVMEDNADGPVEGGISLGHNLCQGVIC